MPRNRPVSFGGLRLLLVAIALVALGALAPSAAASADKPFHLDKTCSGFTCVVTASSSKKVPAGTTITYAGSSLDDLVATIHVRNGSATGTCRIGSVFGSPSSPGRCVFDAGTGSLRQFHLDVAVTLDAAGVWHWDGSSRMGNDHHDGDDSADVDG